MAKRRLRRAARVPTPVVQAAKQNEEVRDSRFLARLNQWFHKWMWPIVVGIVVGIPVLLVGAFLTGQFTPDSQFARWIKATRKNEQRGRPVAEVGAIRILAPFRRFEHKDRVDKVAFSPKGNSAFSISDNMMRLWDLESGRELWSFQASQTINCVRFSPDGRRAISGGGEGTSPIILWDVDSGKELRRFTGPGCILSAAFSVDGRRALTGSCDDMRLWDVETGKQLRRFDEEEVDEIDFSPDGRCARANTRAANWSRLIDIESGKAIFPPKQGMTILRISKDCRWASSLESAFHETRPGWGRWRHELVFSDILNKKEISRRSLAEDLADYFFAYVDFTNNGRRAVVQYAEKTELWDIDKAKAISAFDTPAGRVKVAFSPDDRTTLLGCADNTLRLFDISSGQEICRFKGHKDYISDVSYSPDGHRALSAGGEGAMLLWQLPQ